MRSMPAVIAGIIVVGAILLTISFMDLSPDPDTKVQQIPTKVKVTISGGAWLATRGSNSEVIRGLQVYLLPANASIPKDGALFRALANMRERDASYSSTASGARALKVTEAFIAYCSSKATFNTRGFLLVDYVAFHKRQWDGDFSFNGIIGQRIQLGFITDAKISQTATNVEGKYELSAELQPGSYCVVALDFTDQHAVIWASEIVVNKNIELPLDLYNDTAELILNRPPSRFK